METPDRPTTRMTSDRTPQGKVQDGWSGVLFCLERNAPRA
jgi:hypothetical protein